MWAVLFLFSLGDVESAVFESIIETNKRGFAFLGKFAFGHQPKGDVGEIRIELETMDFLPPDHSVLDVLLYDDEDYSWSNVYDRDGYKKGMTCEQMRRFAKNWDKKKDKIEGPDWQMQMDGLKFMNKSVLIKEATRDRFWYVAVANCHHFEMLEYEISFTNLIGTHWNKQFSVDEQGLLVAYIFAAVVVTALSVAAVFSTIKVYKNDKYCHHLLKLTVGSLLLECFSIILWCVHLDAFSHNGIGHPKLTGVADGVEILATTVLMMLLLLLAQGWAIRSTRMTRGKLLLTCCSVYFIFKLTILIWSKVGENPAAVYNPTFLRVMEYLVDLSWVAFSTVFWIMLYHSFKEEKGDGKKWLFGKLGLFFGPWMIAMPLTTLLTLDVAPWAREKSVRCTHLALIQVGYGALVWLMWHTRVADYFETSVPVIAYDRVTSNPLADLHLDDGFDL